MATALRPLQLHWIEEPVWPPEDYEGLARVRAAGAVIAAGENLCSPHEFRRLFSAKAVDVVQPSVSKVGGVSAMKPIVDLAQTFGVRTVPHCGYLGPGLLATLHVVAALLGDVPVERLDIELEEEPFSELTKVRCGRIALPQGPGLGGVPDNAVLDRCRAL
jgi:L-alanine-DL-glutamate epimerase-like enolase superfamily enzyme